MTTKRVIIADNNITNSDWTKAKSFDFPNVKTVEDLERVLDIPANEPARSQRLTQLAELPWVKVAPKAVQKLLLGAKKQSLKKKALDVEKSLNTLVGGMSEGIVLFKGVPKARKKPPTVTSTDINNLAIRVRQHNAKAKPAQRANLRDLKNVYLRGLEDGDKTSANKRVSKFLSLLMSDKPKDVKYFDDNDLLPLDHPWRNRKTTKKWAGFDEGEYGVKYAEKCCPKVVKRYRPK